MITDWARSTLRPVIYIQHEQANTVIEFESEGWQLQNDLVVALDDHFVRKTTPDSFLNTDLEPLLRQQQIMHLIVCGYASEFCIDTTVCRAAGLVYSIDSVSNAHTIHEKDHATGELIRNHHNCTLPNISSFGVKIAGISTEGLIYLEYANRIFVVLDNGS